MQILDKRNDKENNFNGDFVTRNRTPVTSKTPMTPSNHSLRKKLDQNIACFQRSKNSGKALDSNNQNEQYCDKGVYEIQKGKRQNAKNRGFDMKVNNIACLNQKINSLLNMVKKDKTERNEKNEKAEKERANNRSRQCDSPNMQFIQKYRKQMTPAVSPFIKEKYENMQQESFSGKVNTSVSSNSFYTKYQINDKLKSVDEFQPKTRPVIKEQSLKDINMKQLRRKYLPDEPSFQNSTSIGRKYWKENSISLEFQKEERKNKVSQSTGLDHLTSIAEQKEFQTTPDPSQKKNIDKMIEQRKKKRQQDRMQERMKFEKQSFEDSIINQYSQSFNTQSNTSLAPVSPIIQNKRNQKINNTTKLIDQQLRRIKSKIEESQNNNQKNNIKLFDKQSKQSQQRSIDIATGQRQHTIRIATKLSSQVQLDNQLRQARASFDKMPGGEKWSTLLKQLSIKGSTLSEQSLKEMMRMSPDEHNPFHEDSRNYSIQQIAELFMKAQKNWEEYVCGCTTMKSLIEEGFQIYELDLNQKGSLCIEDIVCFINLYTGHFYRNRDFSLIFRRCQLMAGESGSSLSYQAFQKTLTQ